MRSASSADTSKPSRTTCAAPCSDRRGTAVQFYPRLLGFGSRARRARKHAAATAVEAGTSSRGHVSHGVDSAEARPRSADPAPPP